MNAPYASHPYSVIEGGVLLVTVLSFRYLEEAIMNLDSSHPVTREHMRSVLQGFQRNMNMYLMANPNNKKVKMLLMAVNHLVTS